MATRGPKTENGRKTVSRNAVKHGINSAAPIIPEEEDPREWERHRRGILDSLDPEGHLEIVFAERVANLLWRLKRTERYETEMFVVALHEMPKEEYISKTIDAIYRGYTKIVDLTDDEKDNAVRRRLIPRPFVLDKVQRYEAHLHRILIQTLRELEAMQARRKGEGAHLVRMDIT